MQLKYGLLGLVVLLAFSCKTQSFTPENFEGKMLTFGTEGGFAMSTSENYIFENGQLFRFESSKKSTFELGKIDEKVVNQIFDNYATLGIGDYEINDPGNLSYYIKMKTDAGEKIVKWGGNNEETPAILKQYFKTLAQIVKKYKTVSQ